MYMKPLRYLHFASVMLLLAACGGRQPAASHLMCEYLESPIGIDAPAPRLSWNITGHHEQTPPLGIVVGRDSARVAAGEGDMWQAALEDCRMVAYGGAALEPFTRYYWSVECGGRRQAVAWFETGRMQIPWEGSWITDQHDTDYLPAPYFRKEFEVRDKLVSARAYLCAAGLFELTVNGRKAGDHFLDPVFTDYSARNTYVSFDVTPLLQQGANSVGVVLGNGWYNHQPMAVWLFEKAPWRNRPRFTAEVRLLYADGSSQVVSTDATWQTSGGPLVCNNIYTGERYDARLVQHGWDASGFDDSKWTAAIETPAPATKIVSQQMQPIRITDTLPAVSFHSQGDTLYRIDFGRNIAGVTRITAQGAPGTRLLITHSEKIAGDCSPNLANIDYFFTPSDDVPFQTDVMTLSGERDTFSARFGYKGFRYVQITCSQPVKLAQGDIVALECHSDVPEAGNITSSNDLLDKIHQACRSSYLANLFGYPTDCPQREKNGWTGDGHIAIETGLYNFDAVTVYEKWMEDFRDIQREDGMLPAIIPTPGWGWTWGNGVDWTSAVAIVPWQVYMFYGDSTLLERMYDNIKLYVDYITSISPGGTTDWGLGDWIPYKSVSDKELTSSLYYFTDATILHKAALMFDRRDDAERYGLLADRIRDAVNEKFLDRSTGIYCSGTQTELATPLYWGVVPEELKAKVAENLYKRVEADGFHLDVGLLGTKALLCALSENGYAEAAYRIASQETFPSWGYWIRNGATTFYENWRVDVDLDASYNHIMFGEIGAWLYKGLAGIYPDESAPGFRNTILRPNFPEGLDSFSARHRSPWGEVRSGWDKKAGVVTYTATVPTGATATLTLPPQADLKEKTLTLGAGEHTMKFKLKQ